MKIYLIRNENDVWGAFSIKHKCIKWLKKHRDELNIQYVEIFDDCDPFEGSTMMEVKDILKENNDIQKG